MEPLYQGEPILAVAAVDELTAAEAIEKIDIEFEHLPFVVDPLDSLRPGGPNPRTEGNIWIKPECRRPSRARSRRALRRLRSENSNGPRPTSPRPKKAACPWARRPTNGPTAMWTLDSRMPRWFWMKPLSHAGHQPSDAGASHRFGLLAERQGLHSHGDPEHGANPGRSGALAEYGSQPDRADQRIHRRRLRQQSHRLHLRDHSRAAGEKSQCPGDDAHQPRGRTFHRPRASRFSGPDEGRLFQRRQNHRPGYVRHLATTVPTTQTAMPMLRESSSRCCINPRRCAGAE